MLVYDNSCIWNSNNVSFRPRWGEYCTKQIFDLQSQVVET